MKTTDPEERAPRLAEKRALKMARSAHAYVRGNTQLFYAWLAGLDAARLPAGPAIWICGDCHLGNLGPLADAEGRVDVQIRDLDQTVVGDPTHDLIRLGLSLASAARGADLPGVTTARMLEEMIHGYRSALAPADEVEGRVHEPQVVRSVRRRALGRRWKHLARERLDGVRPSLPLGRKFWPLSPEERTALERAFAEPEVRAMVQALNSAGEDEVALLDAAYWVKGCSSLGALRYAVLLGIGQGGKLALVDVKEARPALAPAAPGASMPADPAQRVVAGARALSPNLGERMAPARLLGRSVVFRELMPQDLKLEVDQFTRAEAVAAAGYLAQVVGRAHARQLGDDDRRAWRDELERDRRGDLDAPNWLWESVVALAARHEQGYLEHCRLYALNAAA